MMCLFRASALKLANADLFAASVVPWSSPVPFFGDIERSLIATVGINPSSREFLDEEGYELTAGDRRFETLSSLGLDSWSAVSEDQLLKLIQSCTEYFRGNPYDAWFKRLDLIVSVTGHSYYSAIAPACHLDLVPYATGTRWGDLSAQQQVTLLNASHGLLGALVRDSPIRLLLLNGRSVVSHFQAHIDGRFEERQMPSWDLVRTSSARIEGRAFTVSVDAIQGVSLGRRVHVLGFNHNIQSSYGVSTVVTKRIRRWVGELYRNVLQ